MKKCDLTVIGGMSFITSNTGVNQGLVIVVTSEIIVCSSIINHFKYRCNYY